MPFKNGHKKVGGRQKGSANKDRINAYLKALEFVMPKQQKIELDGDIHTNLIQVQFESTNVLPIHSETEFLDD